MADISHIAGLVAAGLHPSPFGLADVITTTTHKTLRGPRSAVIFCRPEYAKKIDQAVFPGLQGGPHDHITAAKAICFKEAATAEFTDYARQIITNAQVLAKELASKDYRIVTGGTDNHLLLVDLQSVKIGGVEAQTVLESVNITVNKNTIPYDPQPPARPSGIRLGTPAITSRNMKEPEMAQIASFIDLAIKNQDNTAILERLRQEVIDFASQFPVPGLTK